MNRILTRYTVFFQTVFLLLFGSFLIYCLPLDPDLGWHLAYGKYFAQNGHILRANAFSYVMPEYNWANSYWISELLLYLANATFGFANISLVFAFLFCLFILILFKRSSFLTKFFIICSTGALMSSYYVTVRPLFFSSLFLLTLAFTLLKKPKYIYWLPLLFLLWANFHADFILGIFIFAVYVANTFIVEKKYSLKLLSVFIVSVLVTIINPYGIDLWLTILKENNAFQFYHIGEWLPFVDNSLNQNFFTIFSGILLGLTLLSTNKYGYWYVFLCLFFYILGFRSIYFLRIFILLSVFSLVYVEEFIKANNFQSRFSVDSGYLKFIYVIFMFLVMGSAYQKFDSLYVNTGQPEQIYAKGELPIGAINYMRHNSLEGRVLNHYDWGGFLIWNVPESKTFIDGRMTSWRDKDEYVFYDYIEFSLAPNENIEMYTHYVQKYSIKYALEKKDSKFAKFLINTQNKEVLYEDAVSYLIAL